MKWTNANIWKPNLSEKMDGGNKSKLVVVLIDDDEKTPLIAEYMTSVDKVGDVWEKWYCPAYEECLQGVTKWCDCIPNTKK